MSIANVDSRSDGDNSQGQSENESISGMLKLINNEPCIENLRDEKNLDSNIIFSDSFDESEVVQNNGTLKVFLFKYFKVNTNDRISKRKNDIKNIFSFHNEPISKNNEEEKRKEDKDRYGINLNQSFSEPSPKTIKINKLDALNLNGETPNITILKAPPKELKNESKVFEKATIKHFSKKFKKKPPFISLRNKDNRKDNMMKKIKTDFFKGSTTKLNNKLRKKKIMENFVVPQLIVTDTSKPRNRKNLNMNFGEMLTKGVYNTHINKNKMKEIDNKSKSFWKIVTKYFKIKEAEKIQENNKKLINKLKNIKDEQLNNILNMKMEDIYKEYLESQRFEKSIEKLMKKENYYYIYQYIKVARNFVAFCKSGTKEGEDEDDED